MKHKWTPVGDVHRSLEEVIESLSGSSIEDILFPSDTPPGDIENLSLAAARIKQAVEDDEPICVFGDYDADGVCSMAILFLTLTHMKNASGKTDRTITIRAPRRLSEGYGLSGKAVDEVREGLLITVDNGISAIEEIQKAKEKGLSVIILDHHIPGDVIPHADIVVDPHLNPDKNGFEDFCGAGLAYKLAELLVTDAVLLQKISAIATIGTIADVVRLQGANRVLVKKGLKAMNERVVTEGLKNLIDACGFTVITEESIAFKLAPILNAPGRLHDDGARYSSACLAQDKKPIPKLVGQLIETNETRKHIVSTAYEAVMQNITEQPGGPIIAYMPELHEGIIGIVAGKLSESLHVPAYVLTGKGELKGSGRCNIHGVNLYELTNTAGQFLSRFGGHAGAVGLSLPEKNLESFRERIERTCHELDIEADDTVYYDIEIDAQDVCSYIEQQKAYEPFGEGVSKPTFLIRNIPLVPNFGEYVKYIGKNREHLKFVTKGYSLVGFSMADKYVKEGKPKVIDVIGHIGMNESRFGSFPQVEIIDFSAAN